MAEEPRRGGVRRGAEGKEGRNKRKFTSGTYQVNLSESRSEGDWRPANPLAGWGVCPIFTFE